MARSRFLSIVLALGAASGLSSAPVAAQAKDERAIRSQSQQWQRYIADRNVDKIVALHTPDAVVMASNAPTARGSDAIRAMYADLVKTPGLKMHWVPTKIDVVSPRVATEYGTYTESYDTPRGRVGESGNYVVIWHKVDGEWRIAVDAPISTIPMPASMPAEASQTVARSSESLTWSDFAPPGFSPGGKISVFYGDPFSRGPFVVRLQLPAGYDIPLHWHASGEYVTVISGDLQFGIGTSTDTTVAQQLAAGGFAFIPGRQPHFGKTTGPAILQISGQGPLQFNLGAPK